MAEERNNQGQPSGYVEEGYIVDDQGNIVGEYAETVEVIEGQEGGQPAGAPARGPSRGRGAKRAASKKGAARKGTSRKTAAKKGARKTAGRKTTGRKTAGSKSAGRKTSGRGSTKTTARKSTSRAGAAQKAARGGTRRAAGARRESSRTERSAKYTTNPEEIRRWVEARGGHPASVRRTGSGGEPGILRIDFPGYSGRESLEPISWDEFFRAFDQNELAFLYQDEPGSRFNKFVNRNDTGRAQET